MKKYSLIVLAILLTTVVVLAQPPHHRGFDKLDLTEEQQAKIDEMRLELQKEMIPLRSEIGSLNDELKLEMVAERFNKSKVENLVEKISDVKEKMQLKKLVHQRAIRDLLTQEQQKKFDLNHLQRMGRMDRMERPGHDRGRENMMHKPRFRQ